MKNCQKCGFELTEDAVFCGECGENTAEVSFCGECGSKIEDGMQFCGECGASCAESSVKSAALKKIVTYAKKINGKAAAVIICCVVVFAVIIRVAVNNGADSDDSPKTKTSAGNNTNGKSTGKAELNAAPIIAYESLSAYDDSVIGDWVNIEYGPGKNGEGQIPKNIWYFSFKPNGELWTVTEWCARYGEGSGELAYTSYGKGTGGIKTWNVKDNKVEVTSDGVVYKFEFDPVTYTLTEWRDPTPVEDTGGSFEDYFFEKESEESYIPLLIRKIDNPAKHSLAGVWESYDNQGDKSGFSYEYKEGGAGRSTELGQPILSISMDFAYSYDPKTNKLTEKYTSQGLGGTVGGIVGGLAGNSDAGRLLGGLFDGYVESEMETNEYTVYIVGDYLVKCSANNPNRGSIMKRAVGSGSVGNTIGMKDVFSFFGDVVTASESGASSVKSNEFGGDSDVYSVATCNSCGQKYQYVSLTGAHSHVCVCEKCGRNTSNNYCSYCNIEWRR